MKDTIKAEELNNIKYLSIALALILIGTVFYVFNTEGKNNIEKANVFYEKNTTFY